MNHIINRGDNALPTSERMEKWSQKLSDFRSGTSDKKSELSRDVAGKGLLFFFSLVLVSVTAIGLNPYLAESVTDLIGTERIKAVLKQQQDREEILWFARIIYSESKFTAEQYFIAWAVLNRVASASYPDTYKEVALQPHQFSGLNEYDQWYEVNISRDYGVGDHVWESALSVATEVYYAPDGERLLQSDATHFYSPVAVAAPEWTWGETPVQTLYGRRGIRFAFYAGIK